MEDGMAPATKRQFAVKLGERRRRACTLRADKFFANFARAL
jgi:hypothetical protein